MSENLNQGKKPMHPAGQKPAGAKRPNTNGTPVIKTGSVPLIKQNGAPRPNNNQGGAPRPNQNGAPRPQGGAPRRAPGAQPAGNANAKAPSVVRSGAPEPVIRENAPQQQRAAKGGAQQPPRRAPQQRHPQRPPMQRRAPEPVEAESFGSIVRGIIAVAVTCFIVCVIVIMFSNTIFVSDAELQKTAKTGHLTETAFEVAVPKQQLRDEVVTTKATKKKKTTKAEEDVPDEDNGDLPEGLDTSIAGPHTVNGPVYLHPIADANSANLATIPFGEKIQVMGQSFGWYYVEYDGQRGYAWGTYFDKD